MKIEHIGLQVPDSAAAAAWYVEHLGFRVVRTGGAPGHARFIADEKGETVLEIYNNPTVPVPDYASMDPLIIHIAVLVEDLPAAVAKLLAAGGTPAGEIDGNDAGDEFAMVRDPWGLTFQLMKRAQPLV